MTGNDSVNPYPGPTICDDSIDRSDPIVTSGLFNPDNGYPPRVVAVAPGGSKRGYAYMVAAVYDLRPRKDGTLVYVRNPSRYAWPHRSVKLATADAEALAVDLDIPFWPQVRQYMTAGRAQEIHTPKDSAESSAVHQHTKR